MAKRGALDAFFQPQNSKQSKLDESKALDTLGLDTQAKDIQSHSSGAVIDQPLDHFNYPYPVPSLPSSISSALNTGPASFPKSLNHLPDLDCVHYAPFIERHSARQLFHFLRQNLFFYRVRYTIKRGAIETPITTPRFTTVFGVDATSKFVTAEAKTPNDARILTLDPTTKPYTRAPRPIPACLDALRIATEKATGDNFNICLVNYYASGTDSISYHSDDERFLGPRPAIASFSLGDSRDFLMRHKLESAPVNDTKPTQRQQGQTLKIPLVSGDMILMRGDTQAKWLHSIPKRKVKGTEDGRINITFRKAVSRGGTDNYYKYNVGDGPCFRWDRSAGEMKESQSV